MTTGILIATYNSTQYIGEALASISRQTRLPDQVIVVDDCSTDGTREALRQWADAQRFEVILLSNDRRAGVPAAGRASGLRRATTDLIALLDHDDMMAPDNLETLTRPFGIRQDLMLAFGDATEFFDHPSDGRGFLQGKQHESLPYQELDGGFRVFTGGVFESLLVGSYVPTMSCLFRRKAAIDAGGFALKTGTSDDGHLWMRLALLGSVGYFPGPLGYKRTHQLNLSHTRNVLRSLKDLRACILDLMLDSRWRLTASQAEAARNRLQELNSELRYHAARKGYKQYRETLKLIEDEDFHTKEVLISLFRTLFGPLGSD